MGKPFGRTLSLRHGQGQAMGVDRSGPCLACTRSATRERSGEGRLVAHLGVARFQEVRGLAIEGRGQSVMPVTASLRVTSVYSRSITVWNNESARHGAVTPLVLRVVRYRLFAVAGRRFAASGLDNLPPAPPGPASTGFSTLGRSSISRITKQLCQSLDVRLTTLQGRLRPYLAAIDRRD
jgi:hypothetical protein